MQKVLIFLDKIAAVLIAIFCLGQLQQTCGLNIWELSLTQDEDATLFMAQKSINYIYGSLALLGILLLLKHKSPALLKLEMILWLVLFALTPYWLHHIPSVNQTYTPATGIYQGGGNE